MKVARFLFVIVFSVGLSSVGLGARQLEEVEVLQILQELTKEPKRTWMTAGSIEAIHDEYKAAKTTDLNEINAQISQKINDFQNVSNETILSEEFHKMKLDAVPFNTHYELSNEYSMTSVVTLKYDGNRFYTETNVDSRTDSVKPAKELADNYMTNEFNLKWNAKRVFAWDGQNYTMHSSGNHATIDSTISEAPKLLSGPLAAGVVPWGHGIYTHENLIESQATATESITDGQVQITLTLNNIDGLFMTFVLDAEKNYALLSHTMEIEEAVFTSQYDNYINVNNNWVPTTILLEKFNVITNKLFKRDLWSFTSIDGDIPAADSFEVEFDDDTIVEYRSNVTNKPAMYHNSLNTDADELLAERLTYAANEGLQKQNCATAALKYAVGQLGKEATDSQLAELVEDSTGNTSLLEMKQFALSNGLFCQAVTTDLAALKNLDNCQVILHIPGRSHFVALESIDDKYVRVIDLANDKFYYRTDINFFGMDWTQGVALIISNNNIAGNFTNLNNEELTSITGASGYSCTYLLQEGSSLDACEKIGGICTGYRAIYFERWDCEASESGSCTTSQMERMKVAPCINNPAIPWVCTIVTEDIVLYYMRACF